MEPNPPNPLTAKTVASFLTLQRARTLVSTGIILAHWRYGKSKVKLRYHSVGSVTRSWTLDPSKFAR